MLPWRVTQAYPYFWYSLYDIYIYIRQGIFRNGYKERTSAGEKNTRRHKSVCRKIVNCLLYIVCFFTAWDLSIGITFEWRLSRCHFFKIYVQLGLPFNHESSNTWKMLQNCGNLFLKSKFRLRNLWSSSWWINFVPLIHCIMWHDHCMTPLHPLKLTIWSGVHANGHH